MRREEGGWRGEGKIGGWRVWGKSRAGVRWGREQTEESPRCSAPAASRRSFVTPRFSALGVPVVLVEVRTPGLSSGVNTFLQSMSRVSREAFSDLPDERRMGFPLPAMQRPKEHFSAPKAAWGQGGNAPPQCSPGLKSASVGFARADHQSFLWWLSLTRLPGSWHGGEGLGPAAGPTFGN